ncbi:methyltransferase family protein [Streptomyces xiaopingdaonensis]|uniref:methyltransferase family protein n=1 Tax=Streptomyces xiaopingdaonensis TaxID=1565415 RepID=UPI0003705195|nr:PEMT/PEM2 methyltransferase family protein [Streptomyces xiaopingdaonensis]
MSPDRGLRAGPLAVPLVVAGIVPTALGLALPGPAVALPSAAALPVGAALALLGAWMTAYAVDRVYLRQPTPLGDRPPEHLVTDGWYGIVRNPMAAGMTLLLAGEALLWSACAVLLWAAVVLTVSYAGAKRVEEPSLLRTFGDEYARYRRSVPAWVPALRSGRG